MHTTQDLFDALMEGEISMYNHHKIKVRPLINLPCDERAKKDDALRVHLLCDDIDKPRQFLTQEFFSRNCSPCDHRSCTTLL